MTSASSLAALSASTVASTLTMLPLAGAAVGGQALADHLEPPLARRAWPISTPTFEEPMSMPTK
jgi:hypothetical protein